MEKISLADARKLALSSQWLNGTPKLQGKSGVLKIIEHLGYVQIDTLAVVERAHHHTLWTRLSNYKPSWLSELSNEKKIFEYWSHAASFLSMKDYRFSLIRKRAYANGKSHWFEQDRKIKRLVLNRIRKEGPLQSKDFEDPDEVRHTWYYWKPAKRALEQLFMEGKLMVSHRQGFQKVYDLAERVLPADAITKRPSDKEYAEHLVLRAVQSHGIVTAKEIHYQRGAWNDHVKKAIQKLLKAGIVCEIKLEGNDGAVFIGDEKLLEKISALGKEPAVHILSPFDNLLIQRKRIQRLFNFDYTIECYLPEQKRKFGYFTLPVLFGDRFIARFDPKADRHSRIFYVKNISFENDWEDSDVLMPAFAEKLRAFSVFNGCDEIVIERSDDKKLQRELVRRLKYIGLTQNKALAFCNLMCFYMIMNWVI